MSIIPEHLLQQIQAGNVVLFLGAGASYGSKNSNGDKIPNGKELSILLADKFLGKDFNNKEDLSYISSLCISETSLFEVQQYLFTLLKEFEPCDFHGKISNFIWKAIFTTNYDLILEKAYDKNLKRLQDLVSVWKNRPATQIFYKENILPYYKIHGSITDINDKEAPLILTYDQFARYGNKRERLFNKLLELANDYTFVFIGFGMSDPDIRYVLRELDDQNTERVRSYIVSPHIIEQEKRLWENKKITPLSMTFSEFIENIDSQISSNVRSLGHLYFDEDKPILNTFAVSIKEVKPTDNLLEFISNDIDYVFRNISAPNTDPKEFYKGFFNNWDPILKNLDVKRKISDGILFEIFLDDQKYNALDQTFYLLKGNAGSGKSVTLKRLAYDAATEAGRFCIFLKNETPLLVQNMIELASYVKERIYLFIDNVALMESYIVALLKKARKENIKITIIGAERINVWNIECEYLANFLTQSYQIKYLSDAEIEELLSLLDRHNALYTLKNKSLQERISAFSEKAGRELLVALYEATNSKPFEEIVYDEYQSINNESAQSLYLTVSIFHKIGVPARAGFISRVHNISFNEFKEKLFKPLEYIVFDRKDNRIGDYVYLTRNRMIAEIIFEKVLNSVQDRFDEYIRILNNLDIDYDNDRQAFLSIVNARKLIELFPSQEMVRKIYKVASTISVKDSKLFQQQAIFEMNSSGGSLILAERYLRDAYSLNPEDPIISHTLAEIMLKKAENARIDNEYYYYLKECIRICHNIIEYYKKRLNPNSHPFHTILKAQISKLRKVLNEKDSPSVARCIKDIEQVFSLAKQYFTSDQFLLEIESKFNDIINESESARDLLEQAFKTNKASPFIALRLVNFYEAEGNIEASLNVNQEALSATPNSKELNYSYAMLLSKKEDKSNYDDIKYYLRRSFTKGDNHFQSQFWYGRILYVTNQIEEAKEIFDFLSIQSISPKIKNELHGILKNEGVNLIFTGTINNVEYSYGFIRRDGYGDDIFFYKQENESNNWDTIIKGRKVSFNIGFNYKGPNAINIQLINY